MTQADTEMEEEGGTEASGQDGRDTPNTLWSSLEILHKDAKYKWNTCVR